MFLLVLEYVVIVVAVLFVLTQVVVPIFAKRPLFPLFRKQTQLVEQIQDLNEQVEVERLQDIVDEKRKALNAERDKRYY